ncbi:putative uncharacterized protein [Mycolicibacterium canariasense]|uniref:Uncharacterized protein n=1 Tax=Mycolicibacterium canariasense TaxID=228230 RepID=A0A100WAI5_MYCCR|nr:hypothetical protein [Mycolicibacterium canariasense]MCV7208772.1 hypothetical protein [Mycolicibacterium canariasense]ORV07159.1 hypothetical protein AWB94_14265 [Mycolicibacterium canariasense]GAS94441.1 putative uncharacterized protein [Mycolicibacterium canariasense]
MNRPEVYQDLREDSPTFGAVAVKLPDGSTLGDYGAMTLDRGGSYPRAERLAGWTRMVPVVDVGPAAIG